MRTYSEVLTGPKTNQNFIMVALLKGRSVTTVRDSLEGFVTVGKKSGNANRISKECRKSRVQVSENGLRVLDYEPRSYVKTTRRFATSSGPPVRPVKGKDEVRRQKIVKNGSNKKEFCESLYHKNKVGKRYENKNNRSFHLSNLFDEKFKVKRTEPNSMFCRLISCVLEFLRKKREFSEERSKTYSNQLNNLYRRQRELRKIKWLENKIKSEGQLRCTIRVTESMLIWFWKPVIWTLLWLRNMVTFGSGMKDSNTAFRDFDATSRVKYIRTHPKQYKKV